MLPTPNMKEGKRVLGYFTTLRLTREGRIVFLEEHLKRLGRASSLSPGELRNALVAELSRLNLGALVKSSQNGLVLKVRIPSNNAAPQLLPRKFWPWRQGKVFHCPTPPCWCVARTPKMGNWFEHKRDELYQDHPQLLQAIRERGGITGIVSERGRPITGLVSNVVWLARESPEQWETSWGSEGLFSGLTGKHFERFIRSRGGELDLGKNGFEHQIGEWEYFEQRYCSPIALYLINAVQGAYCVYDKRSPRAIDLFRQSWIEYLNDQTKTP